MSSDVVTSSRGEKRRTMSATKAILDFESCLFLRLPKLGRKAMIGMLAGSGVMELEKACTNTECKKALLEAYEGTEIFGFEFLYELPKWRVDGNYESPDELDCAGLEWAEKRGIIAREFTLKLPDGPYYSAKNHGLPKLISRKRRAMARLIITRCFKSYDINAYGSGFTPLAMAAYRGEEEMLRLLCERADVLVNKQDGPGYTALYWATYRGYVGCMRILLDVGRADVDGLSDDSRTALHVAAYSGSLEAAALLIERGAKVNLVNTCGNTPLDDVHQAIRNGAEMIAFLKSKGAKRASELPQPST